ncbi:cytochrome C [Leptospira tipperaryensis]|uniref:Cytochrome C n=1 Tax=Leptospira tipperaryensis TaxID=2564040 RepID=A0A1D7US68_9LEPT|nr:cytochrome c [Leptospira tipperaryensis]AOP32429.1 cytochrome C [Leptospira tipperaryensis]
MRRTNVRGGIFRLLFFCAVLVSIFTNCKEENLTPEQKLLTQGKGLYVANCSACHNQNPAMDGAVGPAIKGSNFELLKARIVSGSYPPGYTPKRPSQLMTRLPLNDEQIRSLEAYLNAP